jgi:hypothetical protein
VWPLVRSRFAGFAVKRQVIAAYRQVVGGKRQSFRKKAAKAAKIIRFSGMTLPHRASGGLGDAVRRDSADK